MSTEPTFVTFLVPTMGRKTLARAVDSFIAQNDWNWKALIVFDGNYDVNFSANSENIKVLQSDVKGHAGLVRNYGVDRVDTRWIAFVDDDDWVDPNYIDRLKFHINTQPDLDMVIFSYRDEKTGNIQPNPKVKDFVECGVGISFAIKTQFVNDNNIRFTPYALEDFRFLDDARKAGAKYKITHEVLYRVGGIGGWLRKEL